MDDIPCNPFYMMKEARRSCAYICARSGISPSSSLLLGIMARGREFAHGAAEEVEMLPPGGAAVLVLIAMVEGVEEREDG